MTLPSEIQAFVDDATVRLKAAGVKIDLQDVDRLEYQPGMFCSGYFDDDIEGEVVFAVAVGRPWEKWFPIFVHEFCHFEQWSDDREAWEGFKHGDQEPVDIAIEYYKGERDDIDDETAKQYCLESVRWEHDCEKRVLKKIEELGLPLDPKDYAKKANSYVTYYYAMPTLRGWCNGERPYEVKEIMAEMPDHMNLTDEEYFALADRVMSHYRSRCLHEPRVPKKP